MSANIGLDLESGFDVKGPIRTQTEQTYDTLKKNQAPIGSEKYQFMMCYSHMVLFKYTITN